jgi:hypothetical protein
LLLLLRMHMRVLLPQMRVLLLLCWLPRLHGLHGLLYLLLLLLLRLLVRVWLPMLRHRSETNTHSGSAIAHAHAIFCAHALRFAPLWLVPPAAGPPPCRRASVSCSSIHVVVGVRHPI